MTQPIVPPYLVRRARVAVIFARYMADAEQRHNSPELALLETLSAEVLDALDPEISGGDIPRT